MISCAEVRRDLVASLRGESTREVALALDRHLDRCVPCAAERDSLLRTMDVVHQHVHPELSPDARLRLDHALRFELGRSRRRAARYRLLPYVAAPLAAAAGALFALAIAPAESQRTLAMTRPVAAATRSVQPPAIDARAPRVADAEARALAWLASQQAPDGTWTSDPGTDPETEAMVTGSVLLAFAADGTSFRDAQRRPALALGVRRLGELLQRGFSNSPARRPLYAHAFALGALAAIYAEERDVMALGTRREMRDVLAQAGLLLVKWQRSDGGWAVATEARDSDVPCTVSALAALDQLRDAEVLTATGAAARGAAFLASHEVHTGSGGAAPRFGTREAASALSAALLNGCAPRRGPGMARHPQYPVDDLLAGQRPDGAWPAGPDRGGSRGDPMTTAWGALALAMAGR